ncbi:DUF1488 family protein [Falsiroseomonas sp. CW058]|uniref:DUF1488 family protein n=1 Tax=Falsiroseomonas sp. CW058 TaxID=3388664 RepID=UPI003D30F586
MTPAQATDVAAPRWDGRRILFDLAWEGGDVACAISPDALRELSARRCFRPADLLRCFEAERGRVEAIARGKLRARTVRVPGILAIWSDDVEDARPAPG